MIATTSARLRDRFAGLDRNVWLVGHSMGPPPLGAADALQRYVAAWATDGPEAWPRWLDEARGVADGIGAILGAPAGSVSLTPNVSLAQSALASSLDFPATKNEVVYEALQFPSLAYVWTAWERAGARTVRVPTEDGMTIPTERIVAAITDRTAVVVLSHVYYQSSVLIDVPAIVARAREVGALVVLDVYQTAGVVPIDVVALDLDVAVGGSHKWLCGGPGCGYLYVKPSERARFRPAVTGWFAHAEPFAFEAPPIRYADDHYRWATGTPTIPGYLVARPGHDLIREAGVASIREHNVRLTQRIVAHADDRGWRVASPRDPARRGGWVGLDLPDAERLTAALHERQILVDHRPGCGIRVSAHVYTNDADVDAFLAALDELAR